MSQMENPRNKGRGAELYAEGEEEEQKEAARKDEISYVSLRSYELYKSLNERKLTRKRGWRIGTCTRLPSGCSKEKNWLHGDRA